MRGQVRHVQRIQKTLAEANIRLDSVICDIMGASGRRIVEAMAAGERDPRKLAALAGKGIKATPRQLYDALHGRLGDNHRFLPKLHLGQRDALDAGVRALDAEADAWVARMDAEAQAAGARFSGMIAQLASIPGVSRLSALAVLSEIGRDMGRFARRATWWHGRACAPARTRARARAGARACARARHG